MIQIKHLFNVRRLASEVALSKNTFLRSGTRFESSQQLKRQDVKFMNFEDAEDPEEVAAKEALIEQKRNKSNLNSPHYNKQHDKMSYKEQYTDYHRSLRYRRRMYGKFGEASGVDPSILWPSKKEMSAMREFEEVIQPFTFHQLVDRLRERKELAEKAERKREADVLEKVKGIKKEIMEFKKRVELKKKQAEQLAEKKNKLIEEARRHFGYNISTKDPRFKSVLEEFQEKAKKKEKEKKKEMRLEKRKEFLAKNLEGTTKVNIEEKEK